MSVLTESEGSEGLQRMANGIADRYEKAKIDPPVLLYTDRDCCSKDGQSKYRVSKQCDKCIELYFHFFPFRLSLPGGEGFKFALTYGTS